eukprot:gene26183-biopygen14671
MARTHPARVTANQDVQEAQKCRKADQTLQGLRSRNRCFKVVRAVGARTST